MKSIFLPNIWHKNHFHCIISDRKLQFRRFSYQKLGNKSCFCSNKCQKKHLLYQNFLIQKPAKTTFLPNIWYKKHFFVHFLIENYKGIYLYQILRKNSGFRLNGSCLCSNKCQKTVDTKTSENHFFAQYLTQKPLFLYNFWNKLQFMLFSYQKLGNKSCVRNNNCQKNWLLY